jgi:hypothetical protein
MPQRGLAPTGASPPARGTPSSGKFLKIERDWLDYFGNINILSI